MTRSEVLFQEYLAHRLRRKLPDDFDELPEYTKIFVFAEAKARMNKALGEELTNDGEFLLKQWGLPFFRWAQDQGLLFSEAAHVQKGQSWQTKPQKDLGWSRPKGRTAVVVDVLSFTDHDLEEVHTHVEYAYYDTLMVGELSMENFLARFEQCAHPSQPYDAAKRKHILQRKRQGGLRRRLAVYERDILE